MSPDEIKIAAVAFAKKNKEKIANELTDTTRFQPEEHPVSAFMAGSPGAGKTEFSKELLGILGQGGHQAVVRIDGDDLRKRIPGYTGNNSELFQGGVSLIVEKMQDLVLHNKQSFILDGTFSRYEKAKDNIQRSLDKQRQVFIFYVYQTPKTAWKFTQAREQLEGRNIPKSAFIEQFCGAQETVKKIHQEFMNQMVIYFVKKDFDNATTKEIVQIVDPTASIDGYIDEHYTKEQLATLL